MIHRAATSAGSTSAASFHPCFQSRRYVTIYIAHRAARSQQTTAMICRLQPWSCNFFLDSPNNWQLLLGVGCDINIILELEPLDPPWCQTMIHSRHHTALRIIRRRFRSVEQRLHDAQQEVFASGSWTRHLMGPHWQPRFGMLPISSVPVSTEHFQTACTP
jgi:hypothetical protein